jgi:multimeric flavodoxin WrbA
MRGLLLDGEVVEREDLNRVRGILIRELTAVGYLLDAMKLREMEIAPCQGCFGCWFKQPGECLIDDESKLVVQAIVNAELLVLLTPVTFGGYSSELKKVLDRGICLISPFFMKIEGETHHIPRYDRLPSLLGIGVAREGDSEGEQIFKTLVYRNSINFHSPSFSAAVIKGTESESEIQSSLASAISRLEGPQ